MSFSIELTEKAESELDAILAWLSERSPHGARRWFEAWEDALKFIANNATVAPLASENPDHEETIHHWPFKTAQGRRYRLLFIIEDEMVFITNVRGYGQQPVSKTELGKPNL